MRALVVMVGLFACDAGMPSAPTPVGPSPPTPPTPNVHAAQDFADLFRPEIVGVLSPQPIAAGNFAMAIDMSFNLGDYRSALHGWLTLELAPNGVASACIAEKTIDDQRSKRSTTVLAGTWKLVDGVAEIAFRQVASLAHKCEQAETADTSSFAGPTLRCIATGATAKLPEDAIVCEETELPPIGMPLVRDEQPSNNARPQGTGLALSRTGIHVEVEQQNAQVPTYSFAPDAVEITTAFAKLGPHKYSF